MKTIQCYVTVFSISYQNVLYTHLKKLKAVFILYLFIILHLFMVLFEICS